MTFSFRIRKAAQDLKISNTISWYKINTTAWHFECGPAIIYNDGRFEYRLEDLWMDEKSWRSVIAKPNL